MPSIRRGQASEESIRPTLGPSPSAWDTEYPFTAGGDFALALSEDELDPEGFGVEFLTPQIPVDGFAPTREQYYRNS